MRVCGVAIGDARRTRCLQPGSWIGTQINDIAGRAIDADCIPAVVKGDSQAVGLGGNR